MYSSIAVLVQCCTPYLTTLTWILRACFPFSKGKPENTYAKSKSTMHEIALHGLFELILALQLGTDNAIQT